MKIKMIWKGDVLYVGENSVGDIIDSGVGFKAYNLLHYAGEDLPKAFLGIYPDSFAAMHRVEESVRQWFKNCGIEIE